MRMNQAGQGLIGAIITAGVMAVTAGIMMTESRQSDYYSKTPRISSAMTRVETRLRLGGQTPELLISCSPASPPGGCTGSIGAAQQAFIDSTKDFVPAPGDVAVRPDCPQNGPQPVSCFVVEATRSWVENTATEVIFHTLIAYDGNDVVIANRAVDIHFPTGSFGGNLVCADPANPFLVGVDTTTGNPVCRALPANCGTYEYVTSINWSTMTFTCSPFWSSAADDVTCPAGQYLKTFIWNGTNSYTKVCETAPAGDVYFGFQPSYTYANIHPLPHTLPSDVAYPGAPSAINCQGYWGACSCASSQAWVITTAPANGGTACPTTQACTPDPVACPAATPTPAPTATPVPATPTPAGPTHYEWPTNSGWQSRTRITVNVTPDASAVCTLGGTGGIPPGPNYAAGQAFSFKYIDTTCDGVVAATIDCVGGGITTTQSSVPLADGPICP